MMLFGKSKTLKNLRKTWISLLDLYLITPDWNNTKTGPFYLLT